MENLIIVFKRSKIFQVITILIRYILGASFVYASIFKIQGKRFMPEPSKNESIKSLSYFFEAMYQADTYWHFIGWGQLIAGFLLMSQIFSTIGAVAFFTIMLNIFIITISFESPSILLITSLMLMANIYLLIWDWNKLKIIVLPNPRNFIDNNSDFFKLKIWVYLGFFFFFLVLGLRIIMIHNQSK